jgi:hypothetical protein
VFLIFAQLDRHRAVTRAMRRPYVSDPFCRDPHRIAASFAGTFGFEEARSLFFGSIRRPLVIAAPVDVEAGMGKGTERICQLDQPGA